MFTNGLEVLMGAKQPPQAPHEKPAPAQEGTASPPDHPRPKITPVSPKIGEAQGNLRRREDWFRRRSG